ncbi:MAG: sulfatase-like hydrolase/transferase, partial [Burkholderiales bacterium]
MKPTNLLFILSDEHSKRVLGCYGHPMVRTPNLDALAARGLLYSNAWSNAPVCAPARTAIISGMYPTSTGSEHMRSMTALPPGMRMFPQYLSEAGYFCTNNVK